ncbi:D-ribose pyranase [Sporanaerobium hydrogeniformans]|uniref:D-ribose pyranase n=1 Tax=Sporanaerobium hydrogeniformans TaxID=3072179 RepID=A0AC61DB16_9FIRM|nr:D-ribose pyranase [Sporanaerobium hydrogeniformans]PHV70441.1 D-ribose pyranase [Sporanaerobium hydrogeniformans]
MKKRGILHTQLASCIAALGHKDLFMIGDAGMPIPQGVPIVDLALCGGVPSFKQVLDAVLEEAELEYYYLAEEIQDKNPLIEKYIYDVLEGIKGERIPHIELKRLSKEVKFAIRTGEFTPYANVILRAGVAFEA